MDKNYFYQAEDNADDTTDYDMTYQPENYDDECMKNQDEPMQPLREEIKATFDFSNEINKGSVEILENRLYFLSSDETPQSDDDAYYFRTDDLPELQYDPFHKDFGPLKLSMMHRYCWELVRLLQDPEFTQNKIYHYWSTTFDSQANGVCLMGWFMVATLKKSADEAWHILRPYHKVLKPYRDSSSGPSTYRLSIYDILWGLEKAIAVGWYDFKTFDVHEYEYYEKVENGDLNWIIPDKIVALMGPSGKK